MRAQLPRWFNLLLSVLVVTALGFGAREAVAADRPAGDETLCTYEAPWNGPCGPDCNQQCIDRGFGGGDCSTYQHPTAGPIPCCQCVS